MRINLCDPGLTAVPGHHFDFVLKISNWLVGNGHDLRVYSHINASDEVKSAISAIASIEPIFRASPYVNPMRYDRYAGELVVYQAQSHRLAQDLKVLREGDLWLWPSIFAAQVKACALANTRARIAGCVHTSVVSEEYPNGQIWWRDALLAAQRASLSLRLGAIEPEHRYEYLPLTTDGKFDVYPTFYDGVTASSPRKELRTIGFFGHQRNEKGGALVPALVDKLLEVGYKVILHDSSQNLSLKNKSNLYVIGFVPDLVYEIAKCDLIVLPYDPSRYKSKASGILMESLGSGVPVIAPFNTAPGRWIDRTDAGKTFSHFSINDILNSINDAKCDYESISQFAYLTSLRWKNNHGLQSFINSMINCD